MAYIAKLLTSDRNWYGPLPNKAGEFCGNYDPKSKSPRKLHEEFSEINSESVEMRCRFGKPSNCPAGTSEKMAAEGFVGLYLKNDTKNWTVGHVEAKEVDTDILQEEVVTGQRHSAHPFNPGVPMRKHS